LLADVYRLRDDQPPRAFEIQSSRFGVLKTVQWKHAQRGTIDAINTATRVLRLHGAIVEEIYLPSNFDNLPLWHKQIMNTDGAVIFYNEYCTNKDKLPGVLVRYVENQQGYTHKDRLDAMDNIARLRPEVDEILGRYTAVITPSTPGEAPEGQNTGSPVFNTFWTVG
jgi:Asp-tRNA(Asn)/Glu-tRNA(Gln) amidotransferase A subunit family amidase